MADNENDSKNTQVLFPSAFLFPSVVSKNADEGQFVGSTLENLSGFSSFQKGSEIRNNTSATDINITADTKNSKGELLDVKPKKKSKKQNKRKQEHSSESSDSKTESKKKKKKKKYKHREKNMQNFDASKPNTIWLEDALLSTDESFRVDRRCDYQNLNYETLYRLDIAEYTRGPDISCVGLSKKQNIAWSDHRSIKRKSKNKQLKIRYFIPAAKKELAISNDDGDDFDFSNAPSKTDFLSLKRKFAISEADSEKCSGVTKEDGTSKGFQEHASSIEFIKKTEYYNRRLRDNPSDIDGWLEYAKIQDQSFLDPENQSVSSTFNSVQTSSRREKVINEKKLNILEKALTKNPSSELLIIEFMRYFREFGGAEEGRKKWTDFTFKYPGKVLLWQEYLLDIQSDFSNFSMQNTIASYMKCIKTLSAIADGSVKSHQPEADCLEKMMKIFMQYCVFLLQSDQPEKAIASLQAMIEFNCFMPDEVKSIPISGQKEFFEAFWDSEVARFGEEGAFGWKSWMSRQKDPHCHQEPRSELNLVSICHGIPKEADDKINKQLPKHKQWLEVEQQRKERHWRPWKENEDSDEECQDPDRTVLSDDVIHCLFKIESEAQLQQLLLIFLVIVGVPIKASFFSPLMQENLLSLGLMTFNTKVFANVDDFEMVCYGDCDILNPTRKLHVDYSSKRLCFIEQLFSQSIVLAFQYPDKLSNALSQIWLMFEIALFQQQRLYMNKTQLKDRKKCLKKFAKSLLKLSANRSCFELWEIFANMESDFGNRDEAFRVFDMLISMCNRQADDGNNLSKFSSVFRSYASFLLHVIEQEKSNKSLFEDKLVNLLSLLSKDIPTPSTVISSEKINPLRLRKAKLAFQEIYSMKMDRIIAVQNKEDSNKIKLVDDDILELFLCYAIFECFTTSITSANDTLDQLVRDLRLSKGQLAKIAKLRISLNRHHFVTHHTRLLDLKEAVWKSVAWFPEEPSFNALLMEIEDKSFNSLKVRRFFQQAVQNASSINPWVFAILYEQRRHDALKKAYRIDDVSILDLANGKERQENLLTTLPSSGIINRLRGLFQRAVSTAFGRLCVALWRSYIRFEVSCGDLMKAKNIFYQALQNCPWSKVIYLDAIEVFQKDFEDIIDMMQEKEIRIRLPVEEMDIILED